MGKMPLQQFKEIKQIYLTAKERSDKEGKKYHVDHIIPLSKGGSNDKSNTRIRTKSQNSSFSRNPDKSVKKNTPTKK